MDIFFNFSMDVLLKKKLKITWKIREGSGILFQACSNLVYRKLYFFVYMFSELILPRMNYISHVLIIYIYCFSLLKHVLWDYRTEKWRPIVSSILSTALRCAYLSANIQEYISLGIEMISNCILYTFTIGYVSFR